MLSCSGSTPPRRRLGSLRMSLVEDFWPLRSVSVSTASLIESQTNPWSSRPVAATAIPSAVSSPAARAGRDPGLGEDLDEPVGGPVSLTGQDDLPAVIDPAPDVRDHPVALAPVGLGRVHLERHAVLGAQRGRRPPGQVELLGVLADLLEALVGRRAQVDRCLAARRRVPPGRLEELLAGADQLDGPGLDPL